MLTLRTRTFEISSSSTRRQASCSTASDQTIEMVQFQWTSAQSGASSSRRASSKANPKAKAMVRKDMGSFRKASESRRVTQHPHQSQKAKAHSTKDQRIRQTHQRDIQSPIPRAHGRQKANRRAQDVLSFHLAQSVARRITLVIDAGKETSQLRSPP